ncbi:MAG: radical SAM protein [Clostridia bacterium]|nr:radical SAM protein [Clostridia bacterium]
MSNIYVYYLNNKIYINLTNQCSNNCDFCIRRDREGMANQKLWLTELPSANDVIAQLPENLDDFDDEVVFCGFGEPTYNLDALEDVALFLHCKGKTTRINTNGQGSLINKTDISSLIADTCDVVNVSLNASNAKAYDAVCHSIYKEKAFDELLDFAKKVKSKGAKVVLSVVDCITQKEIELCRKVADKIGVPLRVRAKE